MITRALVPPAVARAVAEARTAQPGWAALGVAARAARLHEMARLLGEEVDGLAGAAARAVERPLAETWSAEVVPTFDALRWLVRRGGRALRARRLAPGRLQWYLRATRHELQWDPHGVVGVVTPGNAVLFLALPQIAAALLAGNAVVWKPAPRGGEVARLVASAFARAGVLPGTLGIVEGAAAEAEGLVLAGVDLLHFTGGSEAGQRLYEAQAARGRPAVLELSGRHVAVVLKDADPRHAARGIVWGKLANAGRNCVSVQLVLADRAVAGALVGALGPAFEARAAAEAPRARSEGELARRRRLVEDALARGARLVAAGPEAAALLVDVAPGMAVVDEEIQGPVLPLMTVDGPEEAVAWINRGAWRLSASLWTGDVARARRLARRLDVGAVWINDTLHPVGQPGVPLAGRGASGFGASRGLAGLMAMVQPKVVSESPRRRPRRHWEPPPARLVDLLRATVRLGMARGLAGRATALRALLGASLSIAREAR